MFQLHKYKENGRTVKQDRRKSKGTGKFTFIIYRFNSTVIICEERASGENWRERGARSEGDILRANRVPIFHV